MGLALRGLNYNMCLVYLDDIIVYSSSVEEHIERLGLQFERLRAANLKFKPSECSLLRTEVSFLAHVVSEDGVSTDPEKIKAVRNWPVLTNIREVRSFLGLASHYRKFVPVFAGIAALIHALAGKYQVFKWTENCKQAFEDLKEILISSPVLAMPRDGDPFVLDTDACDISIGAVLSQVQDGHKRVIAYASRTLG